MLSIFATPFLAVSAIFVFKILLLLFVFALLYIELVEITHLTEAFRVKKLIRVLTVISLFCFALFIIAVKAHVFGDFRLMWMRTPPLNNRQRIFLFFI